MFKVMLLILAVLLGARCAIWLVQRVHDRMGIGSSFRHLMATGALGAEVYEGAIWKTVRLFDRKRLTSRLSIEQQVAVRARKREMRDAYLAGCTPSPYQCSIIFLIASILGLALETLYTYMIFGVVESRVGLVWGPFSPLYGVGAVLLTVTLWGARSKPWWAVFLLSAILGGVLEQGTGWSMEHLARAQSWTYLGLPDHITQWVAWRFLFMWGLIGLVWCRVVMPELLYRIGEATNARQTLAVGLLAVFIVLDILMTLACFYRAGQRIEGAEARNFFESYVDTHFDDAFMARTFQNLKFGEDLPHSNR